MTTPQPHFDVAAAADIRTASDARLFVSHVLRNDLGDCVFDARDVLERWPELAPYESAILDLVYEEYARRSAAGEDIDSHVFAEQYPELRSLVLEHIQAHQLLEKCFDGAPIWPREDEDFHGFEVLSEIGRGAFSRVYLARETEIGHRRVVLKVCLSRTHEANLLGQLEHPAIVGVHSVIQDTARQLHALVMPYLGRVTLEHLIDAGRRETHFTTEAQVDNAVRQLNDDGTGAPEAKSRRGSYDQWVIQLMRDVASAIEFAHSRGVRHSDIKPSNILVTPELRAKLLDFNLSQESEHATGLAGGTLPYMSPEQLIAVVAGKQPASTVASDIYAFGLTLYEALTGIRPYGAIPTGLSRSELAQWLLTHGDSAVDLALIENQGLRRLIQECVRSAAERPASMSLVEARLGAERRPLVRAKRWCEAHPKRAAGVVGAGVLTLAAVMVGFYSYPWHQHFMDQAWDELHHGQFSASMLAAEKVTTHWRAADDPALLTEANWVWGWSLVKQRQFRRAAERLQIADQLTPNDPKILASYGYCMAREGDYRNAEVLFERAYSELPLPAICFDLGQCQLLSGSLELAATTFEAGSHESPDDSDLLTARAFVECEQASIYAAKLIQTKPANVPKAAAVRDAAALFNPDHLWNAEAHGADGLLYEITAARSHVWLAAQHPDEQEPHLSKAGQHWTNAVKLGATGSMQFSLSEDYKNAIGADVSFRRPDAEGESESPYFVEPVDPESGP